MNTFLSRRNALKAFLVASVGIAGGVWVRRLSTRALEHPPQTNSSAGKWSPRFFTAHALATVAELAEQIFPATDIPGARDVQVERFIDAALAEAELEEQTSFTKGLERLDQLCLDREGATFVQLTNEARARRLTEISERAREHRIRTEIRFVPGAKDSQVPVYQFPPTASATERQEVEFFQAAKSLTLIGYFTSEVGMAQWSQHTAAAITGKHEHGD